jgi:dihydrofolate reductase
MKLIAIVAMNAERVIGNKGGIPWHLPEDLLHFRATTLNHPVVMGRKTFDSIGRPLPKRTNYVLTRNPDWKHDGVTTVSCYEHLADLKLDGTVFIIGGAEIYEQLLPFTDEILVSHVGGNDVGDTYFPIYDNMFPYSQTVKEYEYFTVKLHTREPQ